MSYNYNIKPEVLNKDFKSEDEDVYIKMLEADSKKSFYLRLGLITFYLLLFLIALIMV